MLKNSLKMAPVLVLAVMLTTGFGFLFDHPWHGNNCCPVKTGDAYCPRVAPCPTPCPVVVAPCPVVVEKVVCKKAKKRIVHKKKCKKRVHKKVAEPIYFWPNPTCCPAVTTCPAPCPVVKPCPIACPAPKPVCNPCGLY